MDEKKFRGTPLPIILSFSPDLNPGLSYPRLS